VPDVECVRSGGVAIAYQVVGNAPHDVVWIRAVAGRWRVFVVLP
jgi:hypothetical protein